MRRAFAALLICGFLALLGLWAWIMFSPAMRDATARAVRPEFCELAELCDHAAPPPVELRLGATPLAPGHRDHPLVREAVAAAAGRIYPYERIFGLTTQATGQQGMIGENATNRLYLIQLRSGGEALVVVRDTFTQRHARLLWRGANLAAWRVRTDADLTLGRFALVDPATGAGDTFALRQTSGSEAFTYDVFAPNSAEIHQQWLRSRQSTCGRGPLTAAPPEWERDFQRICGLSGG